MKIFSKTFGKSYYKKRIVFTFGGVTTLLVIVVSFISYNFIHNLYLDEISSNIRRISQIISSQIDQSYIDILSLGLPTRLTQTYFQNIFKNNIVDKTVSEIFIFDKNLNLLIHSGYFLIYNQKDPNLIIYQKDIEALSIKQSISSTPFKGDDGNWYLWGFHRLNENFYLGVKESAERLKKVEELSNFFLLFGFIAMLITGFISWFIAQSITKPIEKLINFSNEIGKGNFKAEPPQNTKGEIKLLSSAMEKMKQDLFKNQKEREDMLAQIAHEIRNPLGGIELFANLAKEDYQNKNPEHLDKILKEVSGLKKLITAYLDFSKPKVACKELIDLSALMNDIQNVFKPELEKKGAQLEINLNIKQVWFDPEHLRQIIINLISNSIQSIPENGIIKIKSDVDNTNWLISVEDNGKGISKEQVKHIFEPFFTTKKNGTGLGLSVCKKLAEENNAIIEFSGNIKGCTFKLKGDLRGKNEK